jgi:hypothetical protein
MKEGKSGKKEGSRLLSDWLSCCFSYWNVFPEQAGVFLESQEGPAVNLRIIVASIRKKHGSCCLVAQSARPDRQEQLPMVNTSTRCT